MNSVKNNCLAAFTHLHLLFILLVVLHMFELITWPWYALFIPLIPSICYLSVVVLFVLGMITNVILGVFRRRDK